MRRVQRSAIRRERLNQWRARVAGMLREEGLAAPDSANDLAMTIISMFDAGAKDAEVAAFITQLNGVGPDAEHADVAQLKSFVGRLHRAAAGKSSEAAT